MDTSGRFKIDFRDLTGDEMTRTWTLDDSFFDTLDEQDIKHGQLTATLRVKKKAEGFQLDIRATGTVEIPCDRCLEPMTQPINAEDSIKVCYGDTLEDDGERITVPEDRPVLDVSWNIYETIALATPIVHTHPAGQCAEEFSQYLVTDDEPADAPSEGASNDDAPTDARWDALKKLKIEN